MGVQCEQDGAMDTSLGDSGVEYWCGGGVTTNPNCLGSVCVQYLIVEYSSQAQSNQFHEGDCVEC